MKGIKSPETTVSGKSETETDVKIEIKEEFCAALDGMITEEVTHSGNQRTVSPETYGAQRPERNHQFYNATFPSSSDKRLPPRCRLCASQAIHMVDMLDPNESGKNILGKIEKCLPIVVRTNLLYLF